MSNTRTTYRNLMRRAQLTAWTRRRRATVLGAGVIAALVGVIATAQGSLRLEIKPIDSIVARDQPVQIEAHVCSSSVLPTTMNEARPFWQITDESGEVVADSSHQFFTLELTARTWRPRECVSVLDVDWDQREWNQRPIEPGENEGNPRRGPQVTAGTYTLEVRWGNDVPPARTTLRIISN